MEVAIPNDNPKLRDFIITNQLNPMATDCLLRCTPEIQEKVMSRGPCDPSKVRDQVAVIKKRVQHAQIGRATGICGQEIENFIARHPMLDEKARDVIRTSSNQVQRIVLDRGPIMDCANPSMELLGRVREAHKGAVFMDGRPKVVWEGPGYSNGSRVPGYKPLPKRPRPEETLESEADVPVVTWLSLGPQSQFVQAGFANEGTALLHNNKFQVFTKGWEILQQVVQNPGSIQIEHDDNWNKFPGIGEAFKKETGQEQYYCIATSSEHSKWGAGFAYGYQGREDAARLALAVAIILGSEHENRVGGMFPDFAIMCDEAAIGKEVIQAKLEQQKSSPVGQAAQQIEQKIGKWDAPPSQPMQKIGKWDEGPAGPIGKWDAPPSAPPPQPPSINPSADLQQAEAIASAKAAAEKAAADQQAAMEAQKAQAQADNWQMQVQMAAATAMGSFGHFAGNFGSSHEL